MDTPDNLRTNQRAWVWKKEELGAEKACLFVTMKHQKDIHYLCRTQVLATTVAREGTRETSLWPSRT